MKQTSRGPAWIAAGVLALMIAFAAYLFFATSGSGGTRGSSASSAGDGRRAFALLLTRLGVRSEGWRQVPAALPRGHQLVWRADRGAKSDSKGLPPIGMHAPEHYAEFVLRGGTLVVEGESGLEFLRDALEFEEAAGLAISKIPGVGPRDVRIPSGEVLRVDADFAFDPIDANSLVREFAVVVGGEGKSDLPLAVEIPIGAGRAIVMADPEGFDNAHIGRVDNALFAVRLAEAAPPGARVLLDEYALGGWSAEGMLGVAMRPSLILFSLHALLVILLWSWLRAAPRAFPRDPEPLESFSPVLRARAQARLLERANHVESLAAAARGVAYDRIASRWRLPPRDLRGAADMFGGAAPSESDVVRLVREFHGERAAELGARAAELLRTRRVGRRAELDRLATDLVRLEADVGAIAALDRGERGAELGS